uniref:Uncharacterized protein n=1 Tax=Anguilla anguilla TaxID=7936 RepID=A0A0E9RP89_ANGAN
MSMIPPPPHQYKHCFVNFFYSCMKKK